MNDHFRINGSPTADGYYTTYASDEITNAPITGHSTTVQTITATAANPFRGVDVSKLKQAIISGEASARIVLQAMSVLGMALTIPFQMPRNTSDPLKASQATVDPSHDRAFAYYVEWDNTGAMTAFNTFGNGHATDRLADVSGVSTTLIITWHPLT